MKKIKRLLSALLLLTFVLSVFSSCGSKENAESKPAGDSTEESRVEEKTEEATAGDKTEAPDVPEVAEEGTGFDVYSLYSTKKLLDVIPKTYEATIKLPKTYSGVGGVILGNYRSGDVPGLDFRIEENGIPKLYYINWYKTTDNKDLLNIGFSKARVNKDEWLHLTIVDDVEEREMRCYIDGVLADTVKMSESQQKYVRNLPDYPMCIGGDFSTANAKAFKGRIKNIAIYSDVRSEDEIKADMNGTDVSDPSLIASFDLTSSQGQSVIKDAKGVYDMVNNRNNDEWISPEKVPFPENFAYSIAVIGDPQIVTGYHKQDMHYFSDWLIANKEEHKISYVLNVGDITNFNDPDEWTAVKDEIFRLNGVIPYALVRGDHDVLNKQGKYKSTAEAQKTFTETFNVSPYKETVDEWMEDLTNSYRKVEICGNKYLIMTMDKNPSTKVMNWMNKTIAANPDYRVIITTHCYLDGEGKPLGTGHPDAPTVNADIIWARVIEKNPNVEFIISGHMYAHEVVWTKRQGKNGNVVNQIIVNPQGPDMDREGITCSIAMLYFSEDGKEVRVRYYSVLQDKYVYKKSQYSIRTDDMNGPSYVDIK